MNRRTILLALAALPPVALIGCGDGGDDTGPDGSPSAFAPSTDPIDTIPKDKLQKLNLVVAGSEFVAKVPNNFVFGITNLKDEPQGGADATATFYDLADQSNPKPVFKAKAVASAPGVGPKTTHIHPGGLTHVHGGEDADRTGYYVAYEFPHDGFWGVVVQAVLKDGTAGEANVGFQVFAKPRIPGPGMPAPKSDNLTKADVADIREIDSGDPPNDMHDVKIKDAIAAGRPLVVVFSTPAFCLSRFCGPVNEEVEALQEVYRDRVDFVHIEVWRDFDKKIFNPTVREWILRSDGGLNEPFVYAVGKDGIIYDRWEGPVARNIMEPSVKAIAEGKTFATRG